MEDSINSIQYAADAKVSTLSYPSASFVLSKEFCDL